MTLLTETITDHLASTDNDLDPPLVAAFIPLLPGDEIWTGYISPNNRYAAGFNNAHSGEGSMLWLADLDSLETVYNINLGTQIFDSDLLPSVTTIDTHIPIVDDIGSVWTVSGDGGGEVVELLKDDPENPQYRFTLASGGGGDLDVFRIARAFTMPDDTIRVLFVKQSSSSGAVHGWHLWDNDAETYSHDVVTWSPKCTFQDDNGDIWICGVDNDLASANTTSITTAYFKRLTNLGGTSPYTSPITFTGLPDLVGPTDPIDRTAIWGGIANGYFVGGWLNAIVLQDGSATPMTGACNYLLKLNLSDNTDKTITDISPTASPGLQWAMPSSFIPPDQDFIALTYSDIAQRKFGFFSTDDHTLIQSYDLEDWNAENPEAVPGSPNDDDVAYVGEYLYTRAAFIAQSSGFGRFDPDNPDEPVQQFGKLWIYYLGDVPDGEAGTGDQDSPIFRVWPFSLDGHDFAVFRVGASLTLVYDLTTGQWAEWRSPDRNNWRAHVGCNWVGMSAATFARGFGSDVVAGDDATGILWILDPVTGLDDTITTGSTTYPRTIIGGIQLTGRDAVRCGAVQLTASLGNPALTGASVTLRTSDDFGHSYQSHGPLTLAAGAFDQVLEWRSLGLMRQPGRIFEISDTGIARVSGLEYR